MALRVVLAALIVWALGFAGAGHAFALDQTPAMTAVSDHSDEIAASGHSAAMDHAGHHPDQDEQSRVGDGTDNGCSEAKHCVGCAAHCAAIAIFDASPLSASHEASKPFDIPDERCEASDVATPERPPETI